MKELLGLLKEVNHLLRDERDSTVRASKQMLAKLQEVSLRGEANRRRLELLRQKLSRADRQAERPPRGRAPEAGPEGGA